MNLQLNGSPLTLDELREAWRLPLSVELGEDARSRIEAAAAAVDRVIAEGAAVYGVNTGFGQLAQVRIEEDELAHLQENLVRSHAAGVGDDLSDEIVRLVILLKVMALARGHSGVRLELVDALRALLEHEIYPCIPSQGSVGASGDLAPLAHLSRVLLGEGEAHVRGRLVPALEALTEAGIEPIRLGPKEGLALLNGTQVSTALALAAVFRAENVLAAALVAGAMATDATKGSDGPFDRRIQDLRGHSGQADVATALRELMKGSEIRASHLKCNRVQDPYSIRCQPPVAGACLEALRHVSGLLETEANAVTDNPLVFASTGEILSGGNFHAEPVAIAADYLALAVAEIGSLSERRTALLIDANLSQLPAFLVRNSGLNSGFMMAGTTAAALVSENKCLAHPATVDTIPTSANQEDHVSMATHGARRLHDMLDNVQNIVAIELLAAAQGIEFRRPARSSTAIEEAIATVRAISPPYTEDRPLADDIAGVAALIGRGAFRGYVAPALPR
ncbi:MAG: histidine ammonia-lyase [Holophagales bacterium]|nr:histidine ammonia-lyase [Holophagales bacterium]MYG31690.1 histidine ammonia-lyase [Holophagales bacterium]MYI79532.1 histidine ammonia-lyase [Holophagales bacterium]